MQELVQLSRRLLSEVDLDFGRVELTLAVAEQQRRLLMHWALQVLRVLVVVANELRLEAVGQLVDQEAAARALCRVGVLVRQTELLSSLKHKSHARFLLRPLIRIINRIKVRIRPFRPNLTFYKLGYILVLSFF